MEVCSKILLYDGWSACEQFLSHMVRGLSCNSAERHILKEILLNHTWQILYSLRNSVTRCSYTELQVHLKSLWSNRCVCKGAESSKATLCHNLFDRIFDEEVLSHITSLLDERSFSFQLKTRISECCKAFYSSSFSTSPVEANRGIKYLNTHQGIIIPPYRKILWGH